MSTIDFDLKCTFCSANLNGVGLDGVCPTCGQPVRGMINLDLIDPATMSVCDDAPCIECDYNLRTLKIESICPECARPVAVSLRPIWLRYASVDYLKRMRFSIFGLVIAFVSPLVLSALLMFFAVLSRSSAVTMVYTSAAGFTLGLVILGSCILIGAVSLCRPERGYRYPWFLDHLYYIAGVLSVSALASPMIVIIGCMARCDSPTFVGVLLLFSFLSLLLLMACAGLSIRHLAYRAHDRWLHRLATICVVCLVGWVFWIVAAVLFTWSLSGFVGSFKNIFDGRSGVLSHGGSFSLCYVLSLVILIRCGRVLRTAFKGRAQTIAQLGDVRVDNGQERFASWEDDRG